MHVGYSCGWIVATIHWHDKRRHYLLLPFQREVASFLQIKAGKVCAPETTYSCLKICLQSSFVINSSVVCLIGTKFRPLCRTDFSASERLSVSGIVAMS